MKRSRVWIVVLLAGAACVSQPAAAQQASAPAAAQTADLAGWNTLVDGLRDLPAQMLAKLPEAQRSDPQVQQEIGRLALSALTAAALSSLASDGDHPSFVPQLGQALNIGQPNADTVYRIAQIAPGGSYRLRGKRGSLRMVRIAQAWPTPSTPPAGSTNLGPQRVDHDLNALRVDAQDRFDVILSAVKPAGYSGDWWQLQPATDKLLLRMVSSDWGREVEPSISIERLDRPATRPRPSAAELEARLRRVPTAAAFIAPLFVGHAERLRQEGYVNRLRAADFSKQGGLAGQFYYEGAYELRDGEALIVEAKLPARCLYRSLILTNDIYETTDWYNNHSSLNDAQAKADKDGVLRIVVSARDPGVPNWLDTAGYPTGVIQGRWTECDSQPVPSVRKLALAEVRRSLPAETPAISSAQREQLIRDRRAALQQRPLW